MKHIISRAQALLMSLALLTFMVGCKPESNTPDDNGGNGGNPSTLVLEQTQWSCDTTLSASIAAVNIGSDLNFFSATQVQMSLSLYGQPLIAQDYNYSFDGTEGHITSRDGKSLLLRAIDNDHLALTLTADLFGEMGESLAPLFALYGGQITIVYHRGTNGGGTGGGEGGNSITYLGSTQPITIAMAMPVEDGLYAYTFGNSQYYFAIVAQGQLSTGRYTFVSDFMNLGATNVLGSLLANASEQELTVASGTLDVERTNDHYLIDLSVIVDGQPLTLHYEGNIIDPNAPTGSGSCTINGHTYPLTTAIEMVQTEMGMQFAGLLISNDEPMVNVEFDRIGALIREGSYTISSDITSGLMGDISVFDEDNEFAFDENMTSGTLNIVNNGNGTYTITASGATETGTFSATFTGTIGSLTAKK